MEHQAQTWNGTANRPQGQQEDKPAEASIPPNRRRLPWLKPHPLLDFILSRMNLPNDAALCRRLEVKPYYISKVRNRRERVSAELLIALHEETGISIRELKSHLEV
ncbi:bacteriophage CI repressor [Noviherbaspirillum humi]|nr:bacteriophage CI repressor [Noviherbaspirillum humi]